ncbi:helix-turn-helix transcriptional regulator [Sphingobacterium yanglingense]|uniref:AraC-like DNA-binding protein n=1 Tax=Sphingobacterium yanglingense TaxID=1437280 RepID=A0A4R6WFH2_9SPHI|nr:AraC family transcriptional regulator [Sphingobacterium yanglingense]TDQ75962.1 AraC-like DNA-binding protein [Sphingobacterium yanglingense]
MTESGKKASNLEIVDFQSPASTSYPLNCISFDIHYALLNETTNQELSSPIDGFINILYPVQDNSCICPYFLKKQSYVIRGGENVIHPVKKGETLEWKNIYQDNLAIVLFISHEILSDFRIKFEQNSLRFSSGLLTSSDNRTRWLVNQLIDYIHHDNYLNRLRIQALLIDIIVHQIEGLYAENEKHEIIPNKSHYDKIVLARNLIHQDLSKNYTIPELAKYVGTNEQYLKKHFKQYFGKTVMSYITEKKMEHAKELILTGDYRVSDVAQMTGYKHSTHFTSAFKKYFGIIPNSLRYTFLIANEGARILSEFDSFINIL